MAKAITSQFWFTFEIRVDPNEILEHFSLLLGGSDGGGGGETKSEKAFLAIGLSKKRSVSQKLCSPHLPAITLPIKL